MTETLDTAPDADGLLLGLFTDIAILEHLVRETMEPFSAGLTSAQFGLLNHFMRFRKQSEKLSNIAFNFQVDLARTEEVVGELQAMRLVEVDWLDGHRCVFLTDAGRARHGEALAEMTPTVREIMSEFSIEDLRTTARTLAEIRRTFDNLPDR